MHLNFQRPCPYLPPKSPFIWRSLTYTSRHGPPPSWALLRFADACSIWPLLPLFAQIAFAVLRGNEKRTYRGDGWVETEILKGKTNECWAPGLHVWHLWESQDCRTVAIAGWLRGWIVYLLVWLKRLSSLVSKLLIINCYDSFGAIVANCIIPSALNVCCVPMPKPLWNFHCKKNE